MLLRYFLLATLAMHGLAHLSGFVASWTRSSAGYSTQPWILSTGVTLQSSIGRVFGLLWLAAWVALVIAATGLLWQTGWWPGLAIAGSVVSLLVIFPWWSTVPPGAKMGALFDILVLLGLLSPIREWSSRDQWMNHANTFSSEGATL